ncbi:Uncharacterised protein [Mycobacteroides abscessus subsp. abscessus]|nr:Uncharacterised protein [Mycobacteroides abscessus subsp. abscessus]
MNSLAERREPGWTFNAQRVKHLHRRHAEFIAIEKVAHRQERSLPDAFGDPVHAVVRLVHARQFTSCHNVNWGMGHPILLLSSVNHL